MSSSHVVLTTYGEPPTPSFADQLVYSWRILLGLTRTVAPIPRPLIPLIAIARARGRRRMWRDADYGSPLETITRLQAEALRSSLNALRPDVDWKMHVSFEFRRPFLGQTLSSIPQGDPVTVVPMYAADSDFTHALARSALDAHLALHPRTAPSRVVDPIDPDELAQISAAHVLESLKDGAAWSGADVALVLAAHGTLTAPSKPMQTGLAETTRLCDALTRLLAPEFRTVRRGWLNHTRGGRWTEPAMPVALGALAAEGVQRVVYFPYGFLADNAESQLEGRLFARDEPTLNTRFLPCLNDSPRLADALARMVQMNHLYP